MNGLAANKIPRRIAGLNELAYNLWWSWNQDARGLFKALDRPLWKATGHNPVMLLQELPQHRLVAAAQDIGFLKRYDSVMTDLRMGLSAERSWFHTSHPDFKNEPIAYFSMEFALHSSLPLYAGGLGVLAGDYCKEASDLGVPLIGVGFMYPQGYFKQHISADGWQEEIYSQLDFGSAPISRVLDASKKPVKVRVDIDSRAVYIAVWQVNVGRVRLYLLDTDLEDNCPVDRQLSARLYGGDSEWRLQQEIVLGIGGVRMLRALGVHPSVWHANEGHAAFMLLERCREYIGAGDDFAGAISHVRPTSVFTTHTPVPAGNDAFPHALMTKYFHGFWRSLGLTKEDFMDLGALEPDSFNMTVLGLRLAHQRNGVSQLHGSVCRRMWSSLWPELKETDVPITSVTNGVHVPTWIAPQMARLYSGYLGADWLSRHDEAALWQRMEQIPDAELWSAHRWLKGKLIGTVRERARSRWSQDCNSPAQLPALGALLDGEALTLGFSRRFTDYKRAVLVLSDVERLKRLLNDPLRPVQIIFAGMAHPNDHRGKCLMQQAFNLAKDPQLKGRIAFLEDYDTHLARYLVQGVDVWLNTPRPLMEASGTSGMKASLNGIPHLSVLDGWWYEAFNGANGWAIDNDIDGSEPAAQDAADAKELYHILEEKVVPLYYERDLNGVPHGWTKVMKNAVRSTAPVFSARRMLKEYVEQMYLPAIEAASIAPRVARQIHSILDARLPAEQPSPARTPSATAV